jgi:hypothetical protein
MSGMENITAACRPTLVSLAITVSVQSHEHGSMLVVNIAC